MLKFSPLKNNAKLRWMGKGAYSFSLLAGVSCPGADCCKSQVVQTTEGRRIKDGPNTQFRCYSASAELLFKNLHEQRKHNMDELAKVVNSKDAIVKLIQDSLPKDSRIIRLFVSGDFQNQRIFDAWLEVARNNQHIHFYSYTKSIVFWVRRLGEIPSNLILTASKAGKYDDLIEKHNLRFVQVVSSEYEARKLKLPVDTTDKYAMLPRFRNTNFSLVIHGVMPKGSEFAKNWKAQIDGKRKFHGYKSGKTFGKYYKTKGGTNRAKVNS